MTRAAHHELSAAEEAVKRDQKAKDEHDETMTSIGTELHMFQHSLETKSAEEQEATKNLRVALAKYDAVKTAEETLLRNLSKENEEIMLALSAQIHSSVNHSRLEELNVRMKEVMQLQTKLKAMNSR